MIPLLSTALATALSAASPTKTLALNDPRLLQMGSDIGSITTDGDTVYVVGGGTVKKVVYGSQLKVVDSLVHRPGNSGYGVKYVPLSDGLGALFIGNLDTSVWLIDWKQPSSSGIAVNSRWAGYASILQYKGITSAYGGNNYYGEESNITGVRTGPLQALFAGDHGLVQINAGRSSSDGSARIAITATMPDSNTYWFSHVSLSPTDFVGQRLNGRVNQMYHTSLVSASISSWVEVDSTWKVSTDPLDTSSAFKYGINLASDSGKCWLSVGFTGRIAMHHCNENGTISQDTLQIPSLIKGPKFYTGGSANTVVSARSRTSDLSLLAGDSLLAFYDWDGIRLPNPIGTLALRTVTTDADFGDSTFWHASDSVLRGFHMTRVDNADRPGNQDGLLSNGVLTLGWTAPANATDFVVQVTDGKTIDTTIFTDSKNIELRLGTTDSKSAGRTASAGTGLWWRVANAEQATKATSSARVNALGYSAWQEAAARTAGVSARGVAKSIFGAIATENGLRISWTGDLTGSFEILDASGRRLGLVDASSAKQIDFATGAKGLLLVRGADQIAKLTRF